MRHLSPQIKLKGLKAIDIGCHRKMRTYYVRIDNIKVPENMQKEKVIHAENTTDLMERIRETYSLQISEKVRVELWSGPHGYLNRKRLDILDAIPEMYETVWVRGVLNE